MLVTDEPRIRLTDDGFAAIEKSPVEDPDETVNDIVAECDRSPLDPFTVTV
jgi:hypothetical protein